MILFPDLFPNISYIETIEEFKLLQTTEQSTKWHKEGDVWNHTILVAMEMYKLIKVKKPSNPELLMYAALCHDLGKPKTTYFDGDYKCKNHGVVGAEITKSLFPNSPELVWLVRWHMTFHHFFDKSISEQKNILEKLSSTGNVKDLLLLNIADTLGSINDEKCVKAKFQLYEEISNPNSNHPKQLFLDL